jgi:undecaprenyl-diphosphatase
MIAYLNQLDTQLFLFLNGLHSPVFDQLMILFSGKLTWIPLYIFLLGLIIKEFKWQSIMILLLVALLITVSDQLSVKAFKYVFERPRPCHIPELQTLIHLPTGNCGGAFGFIIKIFHLNLMYKTKTLKPRASTIHVILKLLIEILYHLIKN